MSEYIVSLEIETREMEVSGISQILGVPFSSSSHSKGYRRGLEGVWDVTTWKLESGEVLQHPLPVGGAIHLRKKPTRSRKGMETLGREEFTTTHQRP